MSEILTIPLHNLSLERPGVVQLGDSKILPWHEAPEDVQGAILKITTREWPFLLQTPSRENEQPRRTLDRVLTVFKLFKDSLVLSVSVFANTRLVDSLPHYTHWLDADRGLPPFHLDKQEETEFARFWEEFVEINPGNFAVYRFHLADYRSYSADRFTDYVESLEYLLAPDSGGGEIRYKFASRGVLILGRDKTAKTRRDLYEELRDAYDMRSAIVHGDESEQSKLRGSKTWEETIRPIRTHNREAIKFFFREGCLEDRDKRRNLLLNRLLFEAKVP